MKILGKTPALRLETTRHGVISADQTGFILGASFIYKYLPTIKYFSLSCAQCGPEVVIALDAEKAFDRVEWGYLFTCLKKFGYGLISSHGLKSYIPTHSLSTNGRCSHYFQQSRDTRQGCPISPLLFALAIEPLSITLKSLPWLSGIRGASRNFGPCDKNQNGQLLSPHL